MKIFRNYLFFKYIFFLLEPIDFNFLNKIIKKYDLISIVSHDILEELTGFSLVTKKTSIIKIDYNEKNLIFSNFHKTTRNEINQSYKIDNLEFKIFAKDDKKFIEFYHVYVMHEKSQKRIPESKKVFDGHKFCVAIFRGHIISAVSFYETMSGVLRVKSISSLRVVVQDIFLKKIISLSSRRIIWEICQYGNEKKFNSLDLAYVNLQGLRQGIDNFKLSFGGDIIDDYTYTYKSYKYKMMENFLFLLLNIKKFYYLFFRK